MSDDGDTITISKKAIWITIAAVIAVGAVVAIALIADSGGSNANKTAAIPEQQPQTQAAATNNPGISQDPPQVDPAQWLSLWCQAQPGMTRNELWQLMGMPSGPDSGVIPLIPSGSQPPSPNGSDTWQAAGTFQFNAFYSTRLTVQQLDFNGPEGKLACPTIRT